MGAQPPSSLGRQIKSLTPESSGPAFPLPPPPFTPLCGFSKQRCRLRRAKESPGVTKGTSPPCDILPWLKRLSLPTVLFPLQKLKKHRSLIHGYLGEKTIERSKKLRLLREYFPAYICPSCGVLALPTLLETDLRLAPSGVDVLWRWKEKKKTGREST